MKRNLLFGIFALATLAIGNLGLAAGSIGKTESTATTQAPSAAAPGDFNYCQLANPGVRDRNGRFCAGTYGVFYNGYIVDNTCYAQAGSAYSVMQNTYACNFAPPVVVGRCSLYFPSERDSTNRYCDLSYGINFQGQILDNTCYKGIDAAIRVMQQSNSCAQVNTQNYCTVLTPNIRDRAGRYCNGSYGVEYDGYIVDNTCYFQADAAFAKANQTAACNIRPPYYSGRCSILNPAVRDRANRFCDNSYGVNFDGYILDNTCYQSIDAAINTIQSNGLCR
jgi:hypothetical protein